MNKFVFDKNTDSTMSVETILIICWIMFKCLCLISFKHGFLQTFSNRRIFWYKQFYVFSITPKNSTSPLDYVVVSHDLVGRIFIILWFTLFGWFWWHRWFGTIRESYGRLIPPRRSLTSWSWESWDRKWRSLTDLPFLPLLARKCHPANLLVSQGQFSWLEEVPLQNYPHG